MKNNFVAQLSFIVKFQDFVLVVVAEEVVPLVDVDAGRLVGDDLVQEAFLLVATAVGPDRVLFVRLLESRAPSFGIKRAWK